MFLTFSGLESSRTREVMIEAKALGMRAETKSSKCLSPASLSSVQQASILDAILEENIICSDACASLLTN